MEEVVEGYTLRNLELRAAELYANKRLPESEWKTIDDLAPQLAEFEHRVRAGDYIGAFQVLDPIDFNYMYVWGHYIRLVELREKLLGRLTDPSLQAANLARLGHIYYCLGQDERAIQHYEKAVAITHEIGDRWWEGVFMSDLGRVYRDLGQLEQAIKLLEQALTIVRETSNHQMEGVCLNRLGQVYLALGQVEQAIELQKKSLVIVREGGSRRNKGIWLGHLGNAYLGLGQFEQAIRLCEESLNILRDVGHPRYESIQLGRLGLAYSALGQAEQAIESHKEALAIAREIGFRWGESYQLLRLGKALLAMGELLEAQQRCVSALALDMPQTSYQAALALGIVLLHQHGPTAGETFADAAARCRAMLDKTAGLYEPRYALAAALVGCAVCDPRWAGESERAGLLAPALAEYRRALENCAAPGVIRDALRDLEMIRAAGIEGLESAFELLESAV